MESVGFGIIVRETYETGGGLDFGEGKFSAHRAPIFNTLA